MRGAGELWRQICTYSTSSAPHRAKSISFIGLGRMGSEMAYNLFSKTFTEANDSQFVICDALPGSTRSFRDTFLAQFPTAQVRIASTPEEAAVLSRVVVTMLPSSPEVQTVYLKPGGIVPALKSLPRAVAQDTLCIDSTTLDVTVARNVARDVTETGAQIVDAPVSGGVTGAKASTLSFLVGGSESAFQLSNHILAHMGKRIIHCGPSGAGLGAKICNNLILGVEQIVVAEAMLLGQKLGLDPTVLAGVINSSTGGCWSSLVNNPVPSAIPDQSPPCERDYEGGFATALMLKDMGLANDIAASFGTPAPLGKAAQSVYAEVVEHQPELARKDFSSVYQYLCTAARERRMVPLASQK